MLTLYKYAMHGNAFEIKGVMEGYRVVLVAEKMHVSCPGATHALR